MKIEPSKPGTTEQFTALLSGCNAPLPWTENEYGFVHDAEGYLVLQIDPDNTRPAQETHELACWLVTAVNTLGGFRAVRQ